MDFPAFRSLMSAIMTGHAADVCSKGMQQTDAAPDIDALCAVVRTHWYELCTRLWPAFQPAMREAVQHTEFFERLQASGVYYNQPSRSGYAIVDDYAEDAMEFGGVARVIVRGHASVAVSDNAHAYLFDDAMAESAGAAYVELYNESQAVARGRNTIIAHDEAHVVSDSQSTIYLNDQATAQITRAYKVYNNVKNS